jgi:hypothetical protein
MTETPDTTNGNGQHLATDRLTELVASKLDGRFLDLFAEDMPRIDSAVAKGEYVRLTISHLPPLGQGTTRVVEHREIRVSAPLLPEEPVEAVEAEERDEAEQLAS